MNNTFNFNRFGKYIVSDAKRLLWENWTKILSFALIPVILLAVTFLSSVFSSNPYYYTSLSTRWGIAGFCTIIISMWLPAGCYGYVTDRKAGGNFTMIPTSALEKTISMILCCTLMVPALASAGYLLTDMLTTLVTGTPIRESIAVSGFNDIWPGQAGWSLTYTILCVHTIMLYFLLGATFFRKGKISKTILVLVGLSINLMLLLILLANSFDLKIIIDNLEWLEKWNNAAMLIPSLVQCIILYVLIYFRIKKIQY